MGGNQSSKANVSYSKHWIDVTVSEQNPRGQGNIEQHLIEEEGTIIHGGSQSAPSDITKDAESYFGYPLRRIPVYDPRGHQLFVMRSRCGKFYAIPAPDYFSRYSGTCLMLGDKSHNSIQHSLQVGDMLHFGSVGLIVTEMNTGEPEGYKVISNEHIQCMLDDGIQLLQFSSESIEDNATIWSQNTNGCSLTQCYMCFESEFTDDNPLISACQCRGDTSLVHLNCVRKWYDATQNEKACIVSSPIKGYNPVCTVCKTTYKTYISIHPGEKERLFIQQVKPPYICFVVITRHENAEHLFNSKYQLSFANCNSQDSIPRLYVGRSTECDFILDYRTVSGWHGVIKYQNKQFIFEDLRSSNGSLVYIKNPVELPLDSMRTFRLGRTLVSLTHKSIKLKSNPDTQIQPGLFQYYDDKSEEVKDVDLSNLMHFCKWPIEITTKNTITSKQRIKNKIQNTNTNNNQEQQQRLTIRPNERLKNESESNDCYNKEENDHNISNNLRIKVRQNHQNVLVTSTRFPIIQNSINNNNSNCPLNQSESYQFTQEIYSKNQLSLRHKINEENISNIRRTPEML